MNGLLHLLNTTNGRKQILGFSGLFLLLFIIGHVVGNLTLYMGSSALNSYAHWLQSGAMLWFLHAGMLLIITAYLLLAIKVSIDSRLARRVWH